MLTTQPPIVDAADRLRSAAQQFMTIEDTTYGENDTFAVRFRGRLTLESTRAYALATELFGPLGYTPLFRKEQGAHAVLAVPGVYRRTPSRTWVNGLLFALTVVSVLYTGGAYGYQGPVPATLSEWLAFLASGWPYLLSLLGILLAHEFGHYFAARIHKVQVTLPYFLPFPGSPFGTLGAFIQLKSPPTNRRVLLDIGIAGPLAGLVVAIPILLIGLSSSPLDRIPAALPPGEIQAFEGNSILYVFLKWLVFGRWLPEPAHFAGLPPALYMLRYYLVGQPAPLGGWDVLLNEVAWAGWAGLLVTGLNLIPAGQLDGGHALYVLIGKRARQVMPFIVAALVLLGFLWTGWFLYAALIYFFIGRVYAEPLDQITDLDWRRKALAVFTLLVFVLVITPVPLVII